MNKKIIFLFLIVSIIHSIGFSQEVLIPLQENNKIIYTQKNITKKPLQKITNLLDTIELPFSDDFAKSMVFPDPNLWVDSNAFINTTYPINPPTIGVATLEGINSKGKPYNNVYPTSYGVADYLTSRNINLNLNTQDSVYLSFFYQPEGLGERPDPSDSLILEFKYINNGSWYHIWSTPGKANHPFKQIMISIKDTAYLKKGFQFRFKNYATLSGNLDHWHIDYVRLNKNRSKADTLLYNEVAFLDEGKSFIKTYEAMPWSHYKVDTTQNMKDSVSYRLRNNDITPANTPYKYMVYDQNKNIIFDHQLDAGNTTSILSIIQNNISVGLGQPSFSFPSNINDSAEFLIKHFIAQKGDNDTVFYHQNFYNFYAYDVGTAEYGYGLNASGGKIAMRFTLSKADTIRGVQMYFNPIIQNVSTRRFKIMIWNQISPTENIIYQGPEVSPIYGDSINAFHTYYFDSTMVVSGQIYIGWWQLTTDLLNIGLDRNKDNTSQMFYNSNGNWYNSLYTGSWMIRPLFGKKLPPAPMGIHSISPTNTFENIRYYPNPAKEKIFLETNPNVPFKAGCKIQIMDITGKVVITHHDLDPAIQISELQNGLYIIRTTDLSNGFNYINKLIINR